VSDKVLTVDDLSIAAGKTLIVDHVSLDIAAGRTLAVVGESGSGKSMLAKSLLGLLPQGVAKVGGRISLAGRDVTDASTHQMQALRGLEVGIVLQEPLTSLNPALRIGDQLVEGLCIRRGADRKAALAQAVGMLNRLRIPGAERLLNSFPHEFSGGMRQRILLASVLLMQPRLLIADEPTTALDTLAEREVLGLIGELSREMDIAVLLITHNLAAAARHADSIAVMQAGHIVEGGAAREVLAAPQKDYTRQLVAAVPKPKPARPPSTSAPLVTVEELRVVYPCSPTGLRRGAGKVAVESASLVVRPAEIVAVVGGSGSGKTTLGRALLGLIPSTGRIEFGRGRAGGSCVAQMVFQDPYSSLDPRMRVASIVAEGLRHRNGMTAAERRVAVTEALANVGLADFGNRYPHQLSGGQRQRVAIARAIAPRPDLLVADEPVSALDMTVQAQVLALLLALQREHGFACLFISHDLGAVSAVADRIIVMDAGRIVEEGASGQVLSAPRQAYTAALIEAMPRL
jgi:peptide/nickel transport system ATP-binding protein